MKRGILLFVVGIIASPSNVDSVMPSEGLEVRLPHGAKYRLPASGASFGTVPVMSIEKNIDHPLSQPPSTNELLCEDVTSDFLVANSQIVRTIENSIMLVRRGSCTFERKAMNAELLGATGVIVYGALAGRYSMNSTSGEQIFPEEFMDYDCSRGRAEVPSDALTWPYSANPNDALLGGKTSSNLCLAHSPDSLRKCPSKSCFLTGNKTSEGSKAVACCAWDLHIWLYSDPSLFDGNVTIPVVYITMEEGRRLLSDLEEWGGASVVMYSRWRSNYNISSVLIWALGVFVAALAAYASSSEYRDATAAILRHRQNRRQNDDVETRAVHSSHYQDNEGTRSRSPSRETQPIPGSETTGIRVPTSPTPPPAGFAQSEESLELGVEHALGFIILASSGLLILFFFKVYNIVKVMYALGCARAVMQVIFEPLFSRLLRKSDRILCRTACTDLGDVTLVDVMAFVCAYTWGVAWLVVAFTVHHPETTWFFWMTQDIFGACMCILFLSLIKLNSIRVAAILLAIAFLYDIFFVFITPYIFKGESVMITVATSGGPPKADPSWCEKYPNDANCQGGDPLPMLLTIPRVEDYQGGASLLGLGDIVIPGLLLSFAARLDAAKKMLGVIGGGSENANAYACPEKKFCGRCCNGYFRPLVLAYAVGLLMANVAVYLMNYGQPALLYLVPACLGTITFIGWRRSELRGLWDGPRAIRTADAILNGGRRDEDDGDAQLLSADGHHHVPVPTDDGLDAPSPPSAREVEDDALATSAP